MDLSYVKNLWPRYPHGGIKVRVVRALEILKREFDLDIKEDGLVPCLELRAYVPSWTAQSPRSFGFGNSEKRI